MMHGQEKSDPSIVAVKLANKTGQPEAEPVERREGAKGNTGEHYMRRTQSRESVSQELDLYGKHRRTGRRNDSPLCFTM
jgi:RNA-directed DNA polymerase